MFRRIVPLAALLVTGCIERAPSPRSKRQEFGRGSVSDLLVREVPANARPVKANFGSQVELAGTTFDPPKPRPGQSVRVTYYFRVLDQEPSEDFKVFVHVDDRAGRTERINGDHMPARDRYPMSVWQRGEIVKDEWAFTIPSYFDTDVLDLWTGFYHPFRGDRIPLVNASEVANDGQNRVVAASINLR